MEVIVFVVLALAVGLYYWIRYRVRVWKIERQTRRTITGHANAKARDENARTISQRLHDHLPDRAVRRLMRHRPQQRGRLVRIARRGLFVGRYIRVRPDQHVLAVGMTGSGKSSTLRVLADWAKHRSDWVIEIWDGKFGATGAPYLAHARVYEHMSEIEDRLADLVTREFPARAKMADRPHRAIIIDESRIFNELSVTAMRHLITVVQEGRELGVHAWAGLQDPKTSSVPSEIRDQFTCRLVHMLQTAEASQVALKELASAGYAAHKLDRAGQVLIHEKGRRHPARPLFALWLAPAVLAATPGRVCLTKVPSPRAAALPSRVRPSDRTHGIAGQTPAMTAGRTRTRPAALAPRLTPRQAEALAALDVMGSLGPAALGVQLGIDRKRGHEVLAQLTALRLVAPVGDGTYALTHDSEPAEEQES
ncbi:hypothetical protein [Streptomyces prunicolor]|uniref:hypothetical protein n=1 Tax=Streptomyces prunicolor TaxID=67348 RepID=UPI003408D063